MSQLAFTRVQPVEKDIRHSAAERTAQWLLSTITQHDLLVVLCFCAVGLVVTFAALAAFADLSSTMEEIGSLY